MPFGFDGSTPVMLANLVSVCDLQILRWQIRATHARYPVDTQQCLVDHVLK